MTRVSIDNCCNVCGVPLDAEYFDVHGFIGGEKKEIVVTGPGGGEIKDFFKFFDLAVPESLPRKGEQKILASFQLHPQYCGMLTHFAQYTDLYAQDNSQIETPGFEWLVLQNGKPVFPYIRLGRIINPWGYNCLPIAIRLDENARVELAIRNLSIPEAKFGDFPIKVFGGRLVGRYWYNESFGGRIR